MHNAAPNLKVGSLIDLAREARYPILIVNDSDISVPADYIRDVTAPLADRKLGWSRVSTAPKCMTGPAGSKPWLSRPISRPARWWHACSACRNSGWGRHWLFARADLDRIGGFQAIADYIADDYQLGHKLHSLGCGT